MKPGPIAAAFCATGARRPAADYNSGLTYLLSHDENSSRDSQGGTRRHCLVPTPNRIHGIVHGTRAITADTALRLGTYFGVTPETWLNLQSEYDLRVARRTAGREIAKTVRKREAA